MSCYRPPPPPPPPPPSRSWPTSSSPSSPLSRFHLLILVMFLLLAPTRLILMLAIPFIKIFFSRPETLNRAKTSTLRYTRVTSICHSSIVFNEMSLSWSLDFDENVSDTISPLSEQSLSSPVEDTGGYQSEVTSSVSCYRICWFIFCFQN